MIALLLFIALAAFAAGYGAAVARSRSRHALATLGTPAESEVAPGDTTDESSVERVAFSGDEAEEGSLAWRLAMEDVGARMNAANVALVAFVHGSFVGDDPLAIGRALDVLAPWVDGTRAREATRAGVSRILGDMSNFAPDYVNTFASATGVPAIDFTWSGENHHAARVVGAVRLARALALDVRIAASAPRTGVFHGAIGARGAQGRVLLLAHSHGGQLFAILSQLLARSPGHEDLVAAARARGEDTGALEEHLATLRRWSIDVVGFGTPVRYRFAPAARLRVLNVVNHRGTEPRARSIRGLLHTREGDYVHLMGSPGSDFPAVAATDRAINARLDRVLGVGSSARAWLRHVVRGTRVGTHGETVLVDYADSAGKLPNFFATGLGHSAYTRRGAMLFHARLVADRFYPRSQDTRFGSRVRALLALTG